MSTKALARNRLKPRFKDSLVRADDLLKNLNEPDISLKSAWTINRS